MLTFGLTLTARMSMSTRSASSNSSCTFASHSYGPNGPSNAFVSESDFMPTSLIHQVLQI